MQVRTKSPGIVVRAEEIQRGIADSKTVLPNVNFGQPASTVRNHGFGVDVPPNLHQ